MSLTSQITSLATAIGNAVKLRMLKSANLSDVADRQAALNGLTNASAATGEQVLTKDSTTGNVIFKTAAGGAAWGSVLYLYNNHGGF
jgi:hypothetical protein